MDKPFLLMAGLHYYPRGGTKDWIGRYATREEAEEAATALIRAKEADDFCADEWSYADERWVEIVDLRTWEATPKGVRLVRLMKDAKLP